MIRLAVLSHACFRSVNRRVFAELAPHGFESMIVAPSSLRGEPPDPARDGDPPLYFLPMSALNLRTYLFTGVDAVLDAYQPDVVLIDADPASRIAIRTGAWCRRHGAKLACLTAENLDFGLIPHIRRVGLSSLPQAAAKAVLHARARGLVDQVFTINQAGTALFRRAGYARVTQVPLGFDPRYFYPDPAARKRIRDQLDVSEGTVVLGFFGRATRQKGLHHIIEALGRIEARHPTADWRLLINEFQTDAAYAGEIRAQIERAGLIGRISTFSSTHTEIGQYMAASDAVVLASLSQPALVEQFGRVIAEGMACGALAIVSDSGELQYLVGDFGLVFPEGDVGRLAEHLEQVITARDRFAAIAEAGRVHVGRTLTVQAQAHLFAQALRIVTGRPPWLKILMTVAEDPNTLGPSLLRGLQGGESDVQGITTAAMGDWTPARRALRRLMPEIAYPEANAALLARVAEFRPGVVWILKGMEIYPRTVRALRGQGLTLVNYNADHPFDYFSNGSGNRNVRSAVPQFHLHLTYSERIAGELRARCPGAEVGVIPFGHDVDEAKFSRFAGEDEVMRACFLGNPDRYRGGNIDKIAAAGIPIDVYGLGWSKFLTPSGALRINPQATGEDMLRTLRRYRVQLNFFRPHNAGSHNMRSFEVPAAGGIMLAEDSPEHRAFFEAGREAFYFSNPDDMIARTRDILAMPKEQADAVRVAARKRSVGGRYSYRDRALVALAMIERVHRRRSR